LGNSLSALCPRLRSPPLRAFGPPPCYNRMGTENKMTPEIARELRRVAHDLSNALETIVQATYLVSQSDLPESARRWVKMMDQASQEAVTLNRKLREILRSLS
jgi:truncated hemoglobin YjbI